MADISKLRFDGTEYNVKDASTPARPLGNGYSKTGTLPISSTDTISEAIGKLENTADVNQTNISSVEDMICDTEFSTSTAYAVGDIVTHEHGLYKFTTAHSAGAWNSNHVTQIDVVGYVDSQPSGGGGAVNTVYVGTTQYPPDSNGKVSLPAYPTSLPANGGTASNVSGTVAIANGGTGATTASGARSNLGLGSAATKSTTTSVTSGSSYLITSGGVYGALSPYQTVLDSGPKNKLDISLSMLKAVNTSGTWNGNVYTVSSGNVTVNDDGTITVKKSNTSSRLLFYLSSNSSSSAISGTKYAGYIFSGTPQGGSSTTFGMNGEQAGTPWGSICVDLGSGATIHPSSVPVYFYISLNAAYTTSSSGLIFKPMICSKAAFDVSKTFAPYRGSFGNKTIGTVDMNSLTVEGNYYVSSVTKTNHHAPKDGSYFVDVYIAESGEKWQKAYKINEPQYFYQRAMSTNTWGTWYVFAGTAVT